MPGRAGNATVYRALTIEILKDIDRKFKLHLMPRLCGRQSTRADIHL
jgi:hypothetical protein